MSAKVNCPTCGKAIEWSVAQKWRPFCCERCHLIDLGAWADGSHAIAGESTDMADMIAGGEDGEPRFN